MLIVGSTPSAYSSKNERERHLVDFVMSTVRRSEQDTMPSRNIWRRNDNLFDGKQDWGADSEREDWRARLFIHEYAPIIREAASSAQNQIFARADFVNLVAGDNVDPQFAEVLKKLILYYLDDIGFAEKFYLWCLCGGIYGLATWKIHVAQKLHYRPEVIIEMLEKEQAKRTSKVKAANVDRFVLPNSVEDMQGGLEDALAKIFGAPVSAVKAGIGPKKNIETCIHLDVVNPFDYFWEPDCDDVNASPWHAERFHKKWCDIKPLLDSREFDKAKAAKLLKDCQSRPRASITTTETYESQKLRQKNQYSTASTQYWPTAEIFEYFGPVADKQGDIPDGDEARHIIIANGKFVLKDAPIGYWSQRAPYRSAVFNRRPFKPNGSGIADGAVNSQLIINEFISLFADALRMDIYSPIAVNDDMLVDKGQIDAGIRPGETIHLYNGKAGDAFSELPKAANSATELFQTLEFLKLSGQKGSSVSTMSSNPASRARISAKEIESNDQKRMTNLNTLGFEIDVNGIEPLVTAVKELIIQYGFQASHLKLLAARGILTEPEFQSIAGLSPFERFEEAMKNFKVEVRGFRAAMEREQYLSRLAECTQQINQMPPPVHEQIDWKYLVREFATAYGLKADKILRQADERDRAREEGVFLRNGQFIAAMPQDDDPMHLPQHYQDVLMAGPNPAVAQHIMMHIQQCQAKGLPIPPPPPDVAGALGLPEPQTADEQEQTNAAKRITAPQPALPQ